MNHLLKSIVDPIVNYFYPKDPHDFEHSLKFIGFSDPKPIPMRNAFHYHQYQNVVFKALRTNLPGDYANKIINEYHHPEADLDLIVETLKKSDRPVHRIPIDEHYLDAWHTTRQKFAPPQQIRPVHTSDMRFYKWNWHPNVEEPFSSSKALIAAVQNAANLGLLPDGRMSFGNLKNVVFIRLREFLHQIKRKQISAPESLYPLVNIHVKPALTRTTKRKVRVIAGVTKLHVIPSAQFFWPLFRYWIESGNTPMLWGYETILGGMQKLHSLYFVPRPISATFVTVDWPSFDLRVNKDERTRCYDTYESYFDFNNGYIPTRFYRESKAEPGHLRNLWDWIRSATTKMPLRLPDGSTYVMNDDYAFVFSGLFQTQSDDSLINHARILTILSSLGFDIRTLVKLLVEGDDSATKLFFFIPQNVAVEFAQAFSNKAEYYFGSTLEDNIEVRNTFQDAEVLGYRNNNGYPVRDEEKLLAMLAHPRGAPSLPTLMARCCGFQWADAYVHPNVTHVCQDIFNYLQSLGHSPSDWRHQRDVILHGETSFRVPTDHYPSMVEVTRYLRSPYVRTQDDREFYFPGYTPDSHFKSFF